LQLFPPTLKLIVHVSHQVRSARGSRFACHRSFIECVARFLRRALASGDCAMCSPLSLGDRRQDRRALAR
jgi:hypothetical protein